MASFEQLLQQHRFKKIYPQACRFNIDMPTDDLTDAFYNSSSAKYDYLLDLTERQKLRESNERRLADLGNLNDRLAAAERSIAVDAFPGASMWLDELNQLESIIEIGQTKNWDANKGKFTFAKA
jgi:hypothetical protein